MFPNNKKTSLYLVLSGSYCGSLSLIETAKAAIRGGIDILQLREKTTPEALLLPLAKTLADECRKTGVLFIINDNPELAAACGADGVHLGQEDIIRHPLKKTRKLLGTDKIIGVSTHGLAQLEAAGKEDIDYIAFGPLYKTKTKDYCIGDGEVARALELSAKPVVFIGGINPLTLPQLLAKGGRHIAVISAIASAANPQEATKELKQKIHETEN